MKKHNSKTLLRLLIEVKKSEIKTENEILKINDGSYSIEQRLRIEGSIIRLNLDLVFYNKLLQEY